MASGQQLIGVIGDTSSDPRFGSKGVCASCNRPLWQHDRVRTYPEDGPAGSYHYELRCPE